MPWFREKIKSLVALYEKEQYYTAGVIILVGFASFGLGRLSLGEPNGGELRVRESAQVAGAVAAESLPILHAGGGVVGSKSGSKYHFPWCPGAQSIKAENIVRFASVEEARAAGYAPAANCKGLE